MLQSFDERLRVQGFTHIAGVDEAGRGALAGPLVGAAVILPPDFPCCDIRDSKMLSPKQRDRLFDIIVKGSLGWATAIIPSHEIDERGLTFANQRALSSSLTGLPLEPDYVLSDGYQIEGLKQPSLGLIKGDRTSLTIAAASIIAKVTRDRIMEDMHELFPQYGFDGHKGYGTKSHFQALEDFGASHLHRKSFRGVA